MKRPFEIGDRVRVYCGANRYKGEITRVWDDGLVDVKYALAGGSNSIATFQEKQCRRLKPKPKPEKKEARRVWTTERSMSDIDKGRMSLFWNHQPALNDEVEFREVLPGEVVVTRETLAKAWEEMVDKPMPIQFDFLAKSLGLEVKP